MSEQVQVVTKEQIQADKERRARECGLKILDLLKAYDCDIVAPIQVVDGRLTATPQIIANNV